MLVKLLICGLIFKGTTGRYYNNNGDGEQGGSTCGYESCHPIREGYVNVHIIPHSHDDVGWVKTVDQFFYGTKPSIYHAGVTFIYDSVLKSIEKNPDRRFIYVETAFFWRWWQEQEEPERQALRDLVNSGRIEFIGGGWSMNDEAVTHYQSIIDQMTLGLKKLNDTFGECGRPKVGWQIDPFGHSSEMASIFAQLGFDGVLLGRIDFQDKENRLRNQSMELVWRGSNNLGRSTDIFTSVLHNHYDAPAGFCFDILCQDDPLVDDPNSPEYNIDTKANDFITKHVVPAVESYQTSNIIIPMGRDFAYQEAEGWFKNIDRLIRYVNNQETFNNTKYHLMYSTPSCYVAAVKSESNGILSSPLKTDDFFPYATDPHAYWTGYYTSRPTLKRFERMGNNFLQICKQLSVLSKMPYSNEYLLDTMRDAMGVLQHHDAITGTEREEVAYDYARMLDIGFKNCQSISSQALSTFTNNEASQFESCLLSNISQCTISEESDIFVVTLYNPLSRSVNKYVRLPVDESAYIVTDAEGQGVVNQVVPIPDGVKRIIGRSSKASFELVFEGQNIPPLGFKSYYVRKQSFSDVTPEDLNLEFTYSNDMDVSFSVDSSTGLINRLQMKDVDIEIDQRFWYYSGSNGFMSDLSPYSKASGAYIFRPENAIQDPISQVSDRAKFEVYRGPILTEIHQTFTQYVSQVIRLYNNEQHIEFDWVVGPMDIDEDHGKEVISRFTTPLKSDSHFYTDSNGRELLKRVRNFRPTWDIDIEEPESSNYYPVTSKILLRDTEQNVEFAVLTDRAQGGSSLSDGEIELMLLRNTIRDDELGVGEALIEIAYNRPIVARGSHYVVIGNIEGGETERTTSDIEHDLATRKLLDTWIFLSVPDERNYEEYKGSHLMQFSGIKENLPQQVHILTLEPWSANSYLLRLEHSFEKDVHPELSQPVTVNLNDLFTTFSIKDIKETTLGGNQWLKENKKLTFTSAFQSEYLDETLTSLDVIPLDGYIVTLNPMQIRTFIVEVEYVQKFS